MHSFHWEIWISSVVSSDDVILGGLDAAFSVVGTMVASGSKLDGDAAGVHFLNEVDGNSVVSLFHGGYERARRGAGFRVQFETVGVGG